MHDQPTYDINIILLKVANGDEIAFGQLFKIYQNQLGEFIMRFTESKQLTQEIVQDVFLKIWINRSTMANVKCFKAYLLVVARNHAFNCLKQIAREKSRKKEWLNTILQNATINMEESIIDDNIQLIDEAIELLPPQQKKVYTLSRVDRMRQDEIASELNISLETVKKHMFLAVRFLKNYILTRVGLFILLIVSLLKN